MANPQPVTYYAPVSPIVAGRWLGLPPTELVQDGIWTWFNEPRAVFVNGNMYVGWVNSLGDIGISKVSLNSSTITVDSFVLHAALEVDDHDNPGIALLPDGRIMALYQVHNDLSGIRYRISTSPLDISAWGTEATVGATTPVTYANPHYLSVSGKIYNHYRSGQGGSGTNPMNVRAFDGASWDSERTWLTETGYRPYVKSINNGVDRIDFLVTDAHPDQKATSVFHFYMRLEGGIEVFRKSDGSIIAGTPTPAACTMIFDGTVDGRAWVWDITYDPAGNPCVLFSRFADTTDHRYMFSRWTGAGWTTPVEISPAGGYLYVFEPYYSGGICFDGNDWRTVYLSKKVGAAFELSKWTTQDGVTWVKQADMTPGATNRNCRPYSPHGHNERISVLWWSGSYASYTDYNTAIFGAG